ncbi:MAG: regulatory protein TetR [Thermoleophilia bacterium]|nr:regulatory protein TetR [Thermoleophilia bacterium]
MTSTPTTSTRGTAAGRREQLLDAAMREFAQRGFVGGSTERIAAAAGISQPYVFRLFGSKLQLFLAVLDRCFESTHELFAEAAARKSGEAALDAIGDAYASLISTQPERLQAQLAGYAACHDDDVRAAMRRGYGSLVQLVEETSGLDQDRVAVFFAKGMLLNVVTAMQLPQDPVDWGTRLIHGCMHKPTT